MWYAPLVTTEPTGSAVSLEDTKARLRVDSDDDNTVIQQLIDEVTQKAETYCNLYLQVREVEIMCDGWSDFCRMPVGPLAANAVQSITYVDSDGANQTLPSAVYELRPDGLEAELVLADGASWPGIMTGSRITVALNAGYAALPLDVRLALYEQIADRYENRETKSAGGFSSWDALLINYRRGD